MKFKRFAGFLACLPLLLTSCSNGDITGLYSFGMGRETSTSFKVSLELTNNIYMTTDENLRAKNPKCFNFDFSFTGLDMGPDSSSYIYELIDALRDPETGKFPGFYYVNPKQNSTTQLCIGFDAIQKLFETIEEITGITLDSNILEKFLYCTIQDNTVEMGLPVSLDDLFLQLTWYGFYISPINPLIMHELKFPDMSIHVPEYNITDLDVLAMNAGYSPYFCNSQVNCEDYGLVGGLYEDDTGIHLEYFPDVPKNYDIKGKTVTIIDGPIDSEPITCVIDYDRDYNVTSIISDGTDIKSIIKIEDKTVFRKTHVVHVGLKKE